MLKFKCQTVKARNINKNNFPQNGLGITRKWELVRKRIIKLRIRINVIKRKRN